MRARSVIAFAVLVSAGCSGDDGPPVVADPGHVVFRTACAAASALVFPEVAVAQRHSVIVHVVNDSDAAVNLGFMRSEIRISGADAADFEVVPGFRSGSNSTYDCMVAGEFLPPGAWCQLAISFHPDASGAKQATLDVGGAGSLPLSGTAALAPAVLTTDLANLAFSYIPSSLPQRFLLRNDGPTAVVLGDPVVDPPFVFRSWECPANLTPGGACSVFVDVDVSMPIETCTAGEFSTTTTGVRVPLSYTPALPFPVSLHVSLVGGGEGQVTCVAQGDRSCLALHTDVPASAELTAEAAPGSVFVGWLDRETATFLPCGTATSCTVPLPPPSIFNPVIRGVSAWFAMSTFKRITVTIVGTGRVTAVNIVHCDSSCSFTVQPDIPPLVLIASTPGTFVGWSGDCTGTGDCQLGTVVNDRNVTATFSP